jgi:hypothetical protein
VRNLPAGARRRRALLWRREYTFTPPKTSRARRAIDLPAFVVAFLRRRREEQKVRSLGSSDVVIDNGVGEPLAPWTASADFRRIIGELELPRTRFHDFAMPTR